VKSFNGRFRSECLNTLGVFDSEEGKSAHSTWHSASSPGRSGLGAIWLQP